MALAPSLWVDYDTLFAEDAEPEPEVQLQPMQVAALTPVFSAVIDAAIRGLKGDLTCGEVNERIGQLTGSMLPRTHEQLIRRRLQLAGYHSYGNAYQRWYKEG